MNRYKIYAVWADNVTIYEFRELHIAEVVCNALMRHEDVKPIALFMYKKDTIETSLIRKIINSLSVEDEDFTL